MKNALIITSTFIAGVVWGTWSFKASLRTYLQDDGYPNVRMIFVNDAGKFQSTNLESVVNAVPVALMETSNGWLPGWEQGWEGISGA